jgi:hypothetical protein
MHTYNSPLLITESVIITYHVSPSLAAAFDQIFHLFDLERFVFLITFRQLFKLHERRGRFSTVPGCTPIFHGITLPLDVDITEHLDFPFSPREQDVQLIVIHVAGLFVFLFLVGFKNRTLRKTINLTSVRLSMVNKPRTLLVPPE